MAIGTSSDRIGGALGARLGAAVASTVPDADGHSFPDAVASTVPGADGHSFPAKTR